MATKKRTTKRKGTSRSAKSVEMKSFQIVPEPGPFISFKLTRQTAYWIILVMVIVAMQLWILKQQLEISHLTEALETLRIQQ